MGRKNIYFAGMLIDINFQSGEFYGQKTFWEIMPPYLSAIASFATLYLAYLIFKNQDAKKTYIQLQIKEVVRFQNTFMRTKFKLRYLEKDSHENIFSEFHLPVPNLKDLLANKELFKDFFDKELTINYSTYLNIEFLQEGENYLLPKEIRNEIRKMKDGNLSYVVPADGFIEATDDKVQLIHIDSKGEEVMISKDGTITRNLDVVFKENEYLRTPEGFINQIVKIQTEINTYLRGYNVVE
jgi:hypothetical protein